MNKEYTSGLASLEDIDKSEYTSTTAINVFKDIAEKKYRDTLDKLITGVQIFTVNTKFKYALEIGVIVTSAKAENNVGGEVRIDYFKVKRKEIDRLIALEEVGAR